MITRFFAVIAIVTLAGISPAFGQSKVKPYVVMVSFDGFRYDYAERFKLPFFASIEKKGATAEGLVPSFPSKTFPNHYSLVTGLFPGNHGLVDNYFFDPEKKKEYGMRNRSAVVDTSFYGGIPLWNLCRQHGIKSAAYFWVGSEVSDSISRPDYFFKYDQSVPFDKRTKQVIDWLNLPEPERPHFILLYFSSPDTEGHDFGPLATQTKAAVQKLDSLMQVFSVELRQTKLPIDLIFVSDHGMAGLKHTLSTYIFIDDYVSPSKHVKVVNGGTQAHIYTSTTLQRDSLYDLLKKKAQNFSVYRRDEFPTAWHYNTPRAGDILLVAKPGHYITTGSHEKTMRERKEGAEFGVHGYDPAEVHDMYGIFYATGPNIKPRSSLPAIKNVDVYPLVATILGLPLPKIDGDSAVLSPIIK